MARSVGVRRGHSYKSDGARVLQLYSTLLRWSQRSLEGVHPGRDRRARGRDTFHGAIGALGGD